MIGIISILEVFVDLPINILLLYYDDTVFLKSLEMSHRRHLSTYSSFQFFNELHLLCLNFK